MEYLLENLVEKRSILFTDQWAAYDFVNKIGNLDENNKPKFFRYFCNHKKEFINRDNFTGKINTQKIERANLDIRQSYSDIFNKGGTQLPLFMNFCYKYSFNHLFNINNI